MLGEPLASEMPLPVPVPKSKLATLVVFLDVVLDLVVDGIRSVSGLAILEKSRMKFPVISNESKEFPDIFLLRWCGSFLYFVEFCRRPARCHVRKPHDRRTLPSSCRKHTCLGITLCHIPVKRCNAISKALLMLFK